jgi:hypothetical protein
MRILGLKIRSDRLKNDAGKSFVFEDVYVSYNDAHDRPASENARAGM